jgi:hypothetical protein
MQRVLVLLFALTFITAGAAAPVIECVSNERAVGSGQQHGCCGEQRTVIDVAGPCCLVSPLPARAVAEARAVTAKHDEPGTTHDEQADARSVVDTVLPIPRAQSHAVPRGIPIYLQQLSLLI